MEHAGEGGFWQVVDEPTQPVSEGAGEHFLAPHHVSMVSSRRLPALIRQVDSYTVPAAVWAWDRGETTPQDDSRHNPSPSHNPGQYYAPLPGSSLNLSVNAHNTSDEWQLDIARDKGKGKAREI